MLVEVEDGRLVNVMGDADNPDSQGFLCIRGQASREIIGNPARLLHPLIRHRRTEDAWREATWDEALDLIVTRMQAVGRQAVGIWSGHGNSATNYGTRIGGSLMRRLAHLYGCQYWNATMICWGLGAFGVGLTGVLDTNTKEDMGQHADLIILWGANLTSQPNTARHLMAAKRRGAYVVTIDVRDTEAAAQSDEVLLIRPGADAALALAMMQVIIGAELYDHDFVAQHTVGFEALAAHVKNFPPDWAAGITGIPAAQIAALARRPDRGAGPPLCHHATSDDPHRRQLDAQRLAWVAGRPCHRLSASAHRQPRHPRWRPRATARQHEPRTGPGEHHAHDGTSARHLHPKPDVPDARCPARRTRPRHAPVRHRHAVLVCRCRAPGQGAGPHRSRGQP
jgi:anaerobic selenocysteine-containing dehydrogenase